jgi:4-amino-4-deoxy-L-arabinose transferase-like glycosyltransferase
MIPRAESAGASFAAAESPRAAAVEVSARFDAALPALLALGAAVRFFRLGGQSLWIDEVLSVNAAGDILQKGFWSQFFNPHGPVCFYALASVVPLGTAEWILRLPSVVAGVLLVWIMVLLGRELGGRSMGRLAGLLTALSPFSVWYSQEARYVSLFVLLAALSTLLVWRCGTRMERRDLAGYLAATLLMLLSFVGGVFLVLGQNLFVFLSRPKWPALRRWLGGQAILGVLFVPWLVQAYRIDVNPWDDPRERSFSVSTFQTGLERSVRPVDMGYVLFTFGAGFSMGPSTRELHEDLSLRPVWKRKSEVVIAVVVLGMALAAGLAGLASAPPRSALFVLSCLAVPVLGPYLLSTVSRVAYNVRYASGAFPAYLLLLSVGLAWWLRRRSLGIVVAAAVTGVMVLSLVMNYSDPEYFRDDNRGAARILKRMRQPDEPLIVGVEDRALKHYYSGSYSTWEHLAILDPSSAEGEGVAVEGSRLWLASTRRWEDVNFAKFVGRLRSCFPIEQDFDLPGFEILAFRIRDAGSQGACGLRWTP